MVMALRGNLQAKQNGESLALVDAQGTVILNYNGLIAYDATGKPLLAQMLVTKNEVILQVADAGASYPITIDPFTELAKLTASDGAAGDFFGKSVGISGDTLVVGANNGNNGAGSAYVYVKPGGGWATTSSFTAKLTASDGRSEERRVGKECRL